MSGQGDPGSLETRPAAVDEIDRLRAELSRVSAERDALDTLAGEAVEELRELLVRQGEVLADTIEAQLVLTRIRSTVAWRSLEALRRLRLRLRRLRMQVRGLRRRRRRTQPGTFVLQAPLGVNVAGYLNTESGMGEAARLSIRSLEAAKIPLALNNVPSRLRMRDSTHAQFTDANPHPFNLVHLNADNMEWFAQSRGRRYFQDRYTIGYWFWELAEFRRDWLPAFNHVDEVWTASEFVRAAVAEHASVPVVCMPLPVVAPGPSTLTRAYFGLPPDTFVFLFTFDASSQMERKNPVGLVRAFQRAFAEQRDVLLVLKFTNTEYDGPGMNRLRAAAGSSNVVFLEGYITRDELGGLMHAADCYASLHRSEGFGLTIAEAMALGKPVIATRYSGNADFMTEANSYAVDYRLVEIDRDQGPYLRGYSWAEPDLDHAAALMREVVEDRSAAAARACQGAVDIQTWRAPARTGARVRARLEEIRSGPRSRAG
jgi:glycosyltransferase involved in cell wall biosynthesis